jgi:hypothetical protein
MNSQSMGKERSAAPPKAKQDNKVTTEDNTTMEEPKTNNERASEIINELTEIYLKQMSQTRSYKPLQAPSNTEYFAEPALRAYHEEIHDITRLLDIRLYKFRNGSRVNPVDKKQG